MLKRKKKKKKKCGGGGCWLGSGACLANTSGEFVEWGGRGAMSVVSEGEDGEVEVVVGCR